MLKTDIGTKIEGFEHLTVVIITSFGNSRLVRFVPTMERLPLIASKELSLLAGMLLLKTRSRSTLAQLSFAKS